jgi:uncharacterized protein (TIGR00369 family)
MQDNMEEIVRRRIALLHEVVPGSIGDLLSFQLESCDPRQGEYTLRCKTQPWMRNVAGTLHGGMCATLVDQAMGFISYCVKPGEGTAPTVQLQVTYHRPLIPGEEVLIRVKVLSVTKRLMHLTAEAYMSAFPERVCLTSTATYFYKPASE